MSNTQIREFATAILHFTSKNASPLLAFVVVSVSISYVVVHATSVKRRQDLEESASEILASGQHSSQEVALDSIPRTELQLESAVGASVDKARLSASTSSRGSDSSAFQDAKPIRIASSESEISRMSELGDLEIDSQKQIAQIPLGSREQEQSSYSDTERVFANPPFEYSSHDSLHGGVHDGVDDEVIIFYNTHNNPFPCFDIESALYMQELTELELELDAMGF